MSIFRSASNMWVWIMLPLWVWEGRSSIVIAG